MLREYQQKILERIFRYFKLKGSHNLCVDMPTGSGKSHVIAALTKTIIQTTESPVYILMLTHVKELIEQNTEKMLEHWPEAPLGIYSASVGQKNLEELITFGGVQSVVNVIDQLGVIDVIIIDECHLISHKDEGSYRKIINYLKELNPKMVVIGFTATPYRLNHGYINTGEKKIFDDIISPVSIEFLIKNKYLSTLRSRVTESQYDLSQVKKFAGDFKEKDLQIAVADFEINNKIVNEVIDKAEDRRHWLFFCVGIKHAEDIRDTLLKKGITAATITGETPKKERQKLLEQFKNSEIKAITNAMVLTTGFDFPDIDLIVMLRPTLSTALYVQTAGRGMRIKQHTDHCLYLDFGGNVARHGPITDIHLPDKKKKAKGTAPIKPCPKCHEILHARVMLCPSCGYVFPPSEKEWKRSNEDIMGERGDSMAVHEAIWRKHIARSGKEMLKVTYLGGFSQPPITEYFPIRHEGYAQMKALKTLRSIFSACDANFDRFNGLEDLDSAAAFLNTYLPKPKTIEYQKAGKYDRVIKREFVTQENNGGHENQHVQFEL